VPIYDQTYKKWEGNLYRASWSTWWTIARMEFRVLLQRKFIRLIVSIPPLLYFLVHSVQIYAANRIPQAGIVWRIDASFFKNFLLRNAVLPGLFICLVGIFSGSSLIANDLRYNTLSLYLSKPINWWDYLIGKIMVMLAWLGLITIIPSFLLLCEHLLLSDGISFLKNNSRLLYAIPLFSMLIILPVSLLNLALSSLTTNHRYASIGFASIVIGTPVLAEIIAQITRHEAFRMLSIWSNFDLLGHHLFGLNHNYKYPWYIALLICGGLVVGSLWILQNQIRAVKSIQ